MERVTKPKSAKLLDGNDLKPYLLSLKETAHHLSVSYDQVLLMVRRGEIPAVTIGKTQKVHRKKLEEYLDANTH